MVFSNGRAGLNGEHSPCDAVVPGRILDYIVEQEAKESALSSGVNGQGAVVPEPVHLKWNISPAIGAAIEKASSSNQALIDDIDLSILYVQGFGSERFKKCKPNNM